MDSSGLSDELLFQKYIKGDVKSFEMLVERFARPLMGYITRIVRNRTDAEDVLQEVFIKVIRARENFDAGKSFKTWIYTISHNACVDYLRQRKPGVSLDADWMPEIAVHDNPESIAAGGQLSERLEKALTGIAPDLREVFLLREKSGLSFHQIAEITSAPLNTVLGRMRQVMTKLRACVEESNDVG